MTEDRELERQYRKNLMIISSVMLVYSVAGGEIGGEINLSGVAIKFKNSGLLEWLGLLIMYFLCWRHWLVSGDIRKEMNELVIAEGRLSSWCVKRVIRTFLPERTVSLNEKNSSLSPRNKNEYSIGIDSNLKFLGEVKFHSVFPLRLFFGHGTIDMINNLQGDFKYTKDSIYGVSSWLVKLGVAFDYWRCFALCAFKYPSFGDGLLPSLIVVTSTIAFIVNKF